MQKIYTLKELEFTLSKTFSVLASSSTKHKEITEIILLILKNKKNEEILLRKFVQKFFKIDIKKTYSSFFLKIFNSPVLIHNVISKVMLNPFIEDKVKESLAEELEKIDLKNAYIINSRKLNNLEHRKSDMGVSVFEDKLLDYYNKLSKEFVDYVPNVINDPDMDNKIMETLINYIKRFIFYSQPRLESTNNFYNLMKPLINLLQTSWFENLEIEKKKKMEEALLIGLPNIRLAKSMELKKTYIALYTHLNMPKTEDTKHIINSIKELPIESEEDFKLFFNNTNIDKSLYFNKLKRKLNPINSDINDIKVKYGLVTPVSSIPFFSGISLFPQEINGDTKKSIYVTEKLFDIMNNSKKDILSLFQKYDKNTFDNIHEYVKLFLQRDNFDYRVLEKLLNQFYFFEDINDMDQAQRERLGEVCNLLAQNIYLMKDLYENRSDIYVSIFSQLEKNNKYMTSGTRFKISFNIDNFLEMDQDFKENYIEKVKDILKDWSNSKIKDIDKILFIIAHKEPQLIESFKKIQTPQISDLLFRSLEIYSQINDVVELKKELEIYKIKKIPLDFSF